MKNRKARVDSDPKPAAFLFYWSKYVSDTKKNGLTHHFEWYSHSKHRVLEKFKKGDRVWAIGLIEASKYALMAKFVVSNFWQRKVNAKKNEWTHIFEGSKTESRFFKPVENKKFEYLVRKLSIVANAEHLGMSFRGRNCLRFLNPSDNKVFVNHARTLSLLSPRPRSIEEKSRLIGENERKAINKGPPEWREVVREIALRDSRNVGLLKERLGGKCQLCGEKPFGGKFGEIVQAHHIHWLSKGGADQLDNMILLCPNHHAAIHATRARFDRGKLQFFLGEKSVYVKHAGHLKKPRRLQA